MKKSRIMTTILLLWAANAYANAGLPMIILIWPVFGLGLLPIIGVEWLVLKKRLPNITGGRLLYAASLSNIVTTAIGVPITWALVFGVELLLITLAGGNPNFGPFWNNILGTTFGAPWLMPNVAESGHVWPVPFAFLVLLIPFFFMSYWVEARITMWILKEETNRALIKKAVWQGNLLSYALLACVPIGYWVYYGLLK